MTMTMHWNQCDLCGKFIPYDDFATLVARHVLVTWDAHSEEEIWETTCAKCWAATSREPSHPVISQDLLHDSANDP